MVVFCLFYGMFRFTSSPPAPVPLVIIQYTCKYTLSESGPCPLSHVPWFRLSSLHLPCSACVSVNFYSLTVSVLPPESCCWAHIFPTTQLCVTVGNLDEKNNLKNTITFWFAMQYHPEIDNSFIFLQKNYPKHAANAIKAYLDRKAHNGTPSVMDLALTWC